MAAQLMETLLVSANGKAFVKALKADTYRVKTVGEPDKAMETLRDSRFDLILLDDRVFSSDILSVVREIKRRVPLVPVLVLTDNNDAGYQNDLMEAGADDYLTSATVPDELNRRFKLILRQRRSAQTLMQRNQNLQAITLLSRRMHSATEPLALIQETIDIACATFKLYGIAIVLTDGDAFQVYAGKEGDAAGGNLYESIVYLKDYDPFRRVIQSGIVQVFKNIVSDPYYVSIPSLPTPESAIILPLTYQEHKIGAMAVFGTARVPLSHEDLLIYELFSSQFTVALHNARHYHSQRISAQSSQHLLRAWQKFINLRSYDEVATHLQQLVEDIPNVTRSLVWMFNMNPGDPTVVRARGEDILSAFDQLEQSGQMSFLLQQLDERRMQPVTLQLGPQKDPLGPMFRSLRGQQLMLVPIMDSARFIGGILASVVNSRQYSSEDAKLLAASLAHAAGLAVERTTIIQDILQKSNRLEALLRSTPQGIFFVDEGGHIAFCNPQFTELSGINPSEVLSRTPDVLLNILSQQSDTPERVLSELRDAINRVLDPNPEVHEDYPIVQIQMRDSERDILVEFMSFGDADNHQEWAGIIREATYGQQTYGGQSELLSVMSERIRVPYAQIRGLLAMLNEQHSRFSHRERSRVLRQLEDSVERLGQQWENFLEMYNLEVSGAALNRDEVDLYDIVQRVLESRAFMDIRRHVLVDAPARLPSILLDETRMEIAVANVLNNAITFSPRGAQISVKFQVTEDEIRLSVQDQGIGIPADQQAMVFEPFYQANNHTGEEGAGLGLYVAREIIRRHGGEIWIDSQSGQGTTVVIALPLNGADAVQLVAAPPTELPSHRRQESLPPAAIPQRVPAAVPGRRVSERPMQTIMLVEGRSTLMARLKTKMEEQGYELISYRAGEEALRDVASVRLDLIFLDVTLSDANGLDICERMCKRTEVPIIMLADEPSEAEKVRALMIGADDYIAQPIGDDELIARVNVIFKRRRIPDRTREPLDLGNLYVDFARREVFLNNKPLELTRIEYDLLHTLAVNQGQVLTHKQLLEKVWGPEYQAETQYLWVNVSRLRKKLEPTPDSPRYIHTQPGVGYVFRPS